MDSRDPQSPTASGDCLSRESALESAIRVAIERLRDAEVESPETGELFYQFDVERIIADLEHAIR